MNTIKLFKKYEASDKFYSMSGYIVSLIVTQFKAVDWRPCGGDILSWSLEGHLCLRRFLLHDKCNIVNKNSTTKSANFSIYETNEQLDLQVFNKMK
jgi:hypothetical protein